MTNKNQKTHGFTLIELSIVFVIIGLIVGGVLVGRDLITASQVRAQISQVEKYNQAVNVFRGKFDALPGDMNAAAAAQFGLTVGVGCDGTQGQRDGNSIIEDVTPNNYSQAVGETGLFWQDLSSQKLIDTTIPNGGAVLGCTGCPAVSNTNLVKYFPTAVTGNGNYFYAYGYNDSNWLGITSINRVATCANMVSNNGGLNVGQAANIDKKIDDSFPRTGNVQASIPSQTTLGWSYYSGGSTDSFQCFQYHPSYAPSGLYSINAATGENANRANCSLSFKMQ